MKMKAALTAVSRAKDLTDSDRAHLARWAIDGWPENPVWKELSAKADKYGMLPAGSAYASLIHESLSARRHAESVRHGNDPDLRDRRQFYGYQLDLAKKSEDLARYYEWAEGYSGIATFFQRFLKPVEQLREFHLKEARLLRQRAGREPEPSAHVSRQDRSKHRAGLRALHAYIDLMDKFIKDWICKDSDLRAIAVLSEIAFPGYDVDSEDVRKALQVTVAAARRAAAIRKNTVRVLKGKKT